MYEVLKQEGKAKRARLTTVHGTIETPVFMNVGTVAAIKGGVSSPELHSLKTQVELCNTYHLHVRPGDKIVKQLGGVRKFMNWDGPVLTDSGGFQVFSLAKLRKIKASSLLTGRPDGLSAVKLRWQDLTAFPTLSIHTRCCSVLIREQSTRISEYATRKKYQLLISTGTQ